MNRKLLTFGERVFCIFQDETMLTRFLRLTFSAAALCGVPVLLPAQTGTQPAAQGQATAPRQSGTVKAVTPNDLVLTTAGGQDVAVTIPATAKVLLVDPATRDIKNARPGTVADIAGGDRAIISGTAGDSGSGFTATRIYLLKSGAIQAMHQEQEAEWARSVGGIVKTSDAAAGTLTVVNGARLYTVKTTPNTTVRRYASGSVRFEDAAKSTLDAIHPGDQLQVRGQRSPDSLTVTADEIVDGSFSNFSGVLTAVDASAGSVTLKDLATKKTVTVAVTPQTNLRKLPPGFGQRSGGRATSGTRPEGGQTSQGAGDHPSGNRGGEDAAGAGSGRRTDLARLVNRLPTEALSDLKQGDAVMIVASNGESSGQPTAITLLSGAEGILAASPNGETTLSPWSLGGAESEGGEAGGSGGGGGGSH